MTMRQREPSLHEPSQSKPEQESVCGPLLPTSPLTLPKCMHSPRYLNHRSTRCQDKRMADVGLHTFALLARVMSTARLLSLPGRRSPDRILRVPMRKV